MLLCSGAFVAQARVVREVSNSSESTMSTGGTCSASTTLTNADRNTVSALLAGTITTQPAPNTVTVLCSGTTNLQSISYGPERTRAPPVNA